MSSRILRTLSRLSLAALSLALPACNVVVFAEDTEGTTTADGPDTGAETTQTLPTGGPEDAGTGSASDDTSPTADPTGEPGACDFVGTIQPIFTASCGCHGGPQPAQGMSLAEGSAYASLVGVASTQQPGTQRVEPGAADTSWLTIKLDVDPPVGDRMPVGGALDAAQRDVIAAWIAAGAPAQATFACAGGSGDVADVDIDVDGPIQVQVGEIVTVAAIVRGPDGEPLPAAAVTWSSSAELALYVDGGGALLGVSPGTAALQAHSAGVDSPPVMVEVVAHSPPAATFSQVRAVTDKRCAVAGCHVDGVEPGDLRFDRDPDKLWEELVEDEAEEVDAPRVEPDAPEASYLVQKLVQRSPAVGAQMPIGAAPMPATEVQVIVRWVLDGAPFN